MKNLSKKILAILLTLALLASFPMAHLSAEDAVENAKNDLISAWQTIATQTRVEKETLAVPGDSFMDIDGNIHPQIAVTEDTKVAGNNMNDVSRLGDYYVEFVKFSTTGNAAGWNFTPSLTPVRADIKLTEYDKVYMYFAAFDANKVQAPSGSVYVQLNNGGSGEGTVYFYSANWKPIEFSIKADSISSTKIIANGSNITYLSFGSLVGEKTVTGPALPENYADMSLISLVKAARELDVAGYEAEATFKSALAAAEAYFDEKDFAKEELVEAWSNIASESKVVKETLAVPRESFADVEGNTHNRIEVTEDTVVAGDGLYELGDYYAEYVKFSTNNTAPGWNYTPTLIYARAGIKLTEYDSVYMYLAAFDANKVQVNYAALSAQLNNGSSGDFNGEFYSPYWKKFVFNVKGDEIGNPKIIFSKGDITYVSFGSIIGEKTVAAPALPENYEDMSLVALVKAAREEDFGGFASSETFAEALASAEAALGAKDFAYEALVEAWANIAGESKVVKETLAIPGDSFKDIDGNVHPQIAVTEDTKVAGNNMNDVSRLGDYYAEFVKFSKNGNAAGWDFTPSLTPVRADIKLTEYDKVYMYFAAFDANKVQAPSGSVYVQLNNGGSGEGTVYFYSANWKPIEFSIKADSISSTKIIASGSNITYLSFGSLVGEKTVIAPALPENYEDMSLVALVKAARAEDFSGFASSEAFANALATAEALLTEKDFAYDELVEAWSNIASESKVVKETLAVPRESFADVEGNTHNRIEVTEDTVVAGAGSPELGDYYAEYVKFSTNNTAPGWNYTPTLIYARSGIKLTEYDSVYMYLAAFDANKVQVNYAALSAQLNNGSSGDFIGEFYSPYWKKFVFNVKGDEIGNPKIIFSKGDITYVSFGSVIGEKTVYATALPSDYSKMSLEELVAVANDGDFEGFASSEVFEAVLAKANALLNDNAGDLDGDSKVDSSDVATLKKIVLGALEEVAAADLNGDETVDVRDIVCLKKMLVA